MTHTLLRRTALPALVTASLLLAGAPAAQAETVTVRDGDDSAIDADILRTRVAHGDALTVRAPMERLRRSKREVVQGMNLYVDLRRRDPGPELVVEAGLWRRADHVVTRARGWGLGPTVECGSTLFLDSAADVASIRLAADCLPERHPRARVAVYTYESTEAGVAGDWQTARRTFGPWVARGAV